MNPNFKSSPLSHLIVMFSVIVTIGIFIVFYQMKLLKSSETLLELSKNISRFSEDLDELRKNVSETSANVSNLQIKLSNYEQNISRFSKDVIDRPKYASELSSKLQNNVQTSNLESVYQNLYTFGGIDQNKKVLSSASRFDPSSGKWMAIKDLPVARTEFCGAVVKNKIYLFGGEAANGSRLDLAEVYDTVTDTYEQLRPMPDQRYICGAVAFNDYIYVNGGIGTYNMIRYDIRTNLWTTLSKHRRRWGHQLVILADRLYAVGGDSLRTVEVYDPIVDRWSSVAKSKYEHFDSSVAVHEGKIYVCDHEGFEVYTPETDQWQILPNTHEYMFFSSLVSMNGKLWAVGGGVPASKKVFTYDTLTEYWTQQPDMDVARGDHTAFVVNHYN